MELIRTLGHQALGLTRNLGSFALLFLRAIGQLHNMHRDRALYIDQMYRLGVTALPLVSIIAIFAGAVAGWQGAYQLDGYLPLRFLGMIVGGGVMIEMGPVLTGLVLAGRNGSSIAAELATMRVTEQVEALESMGINPIRQLVTPRMIAMLIMLPLLTLWCDLVAVFAGYLTAHYFWDLNFDTFFNSLQSDFEMGVHFWPGFAKAISFGLSTSLISCWVGLHASFGASGVGRAAIEAFVYSSGMILAFDFIMAALLI